MNKHPKVSVLLPVYNAAPFLGEAIDSLLVQTFKDFELVIVNDGSTDDSDAIIKKYNDPRIRYFSLPENKGRSFADNYAFRESRGELIAKMDADDIAMSDRLMKQVDYLNKYQQVDSVGCRVKYFGDISRHSEYVLKQPNHVLCSNLFGLPSHNQTVLIRRTAIERLNLSYDESLERATAGDAVFFATAFPLLKVSNINQVLMKVRRYKGIEVPKSKELLSKRLNSNRRAMRMVLDKIRLSYAEQDLDLHIRLRKPRVYSIVDLAAIENWFVRIVEQNKVIQVFDSNALNEVLSYRMYLCCYQSASLNALKFFYASRFNSLRLVPTFLLMKFVPKIAFGRKG